MGTFESILYVTDKVGDQTTALSRAVGVAERNGAALTVLGVIPSSAGASAGGDLGTHLAALEADVAGFRSGLHIQVKVAAGALFVEAIRAVLRDGHDLVMKAAENPSFLKSLFGSTDMHLLHKCPCPLWLMKLPAQASYEDIIAAVDFDPDDLSPTVQGLNHAILELAGSIAMNEDATLHLVHAWEAYAELSMRVVSDVPDERIAAHLQTQQIRHESGLNALGEALKEVLGAEGYAHVSPRFHLLKGSPRKVIAELAAELPADLVVMGTVARTGVPGLIIDNTAQIILNQLSCSVLAIKPPGFQTPVRLD
ncbi:MAG: universal stress protein [Actinobacteria bacterium]|nr:universal stress protein [Actinomycetota bacterium]